MGKESLATQQYEEGTLHHDLKLLADELKTVCEVSAFKQIDIDAGLIDAQYPVVGSRSLVRPDVGAR